LYEDEDEEEDQLANDSSDPLDLPPIETLPRKTAGGAEQSASAIITSVPFQVSDVGDELFDIPLRTRKGKDRVSALAKRKR
jgi:hypothetical protein